MRFVVGIVALLVAFAASLMLVLEHIVGITAPGCGPGSACAKAAASIWGKLPVIGWPTSFVGLAYFAAMLLAWLWTGGRLRFALGSIAGIGGIVSIALTAVMIVGGYLCPYCIAVHLGNIVFVALVVPTLSANNGAPAKNAGKAAPAKSAVMPFVATLLVVTVALFIAELTVTAKVQEKAEQDLAETSTKLANAPREAEPFTGRFLRGPENAPIRLVVISDFQCVDCKRIEGEIEELLAERTDLSLSTKNFPMSSVCNPYMTSNPHPNACWAARAAEAAGILRGNDGYWQMYDWLFGRGGAFTPDELFEGLRTMNYDLDEFKRVMEGPETLALVHADIEEAIALGIHFTPMIFINGVELKGWTAKDAVRRMVERVAASNPQPASPASDQPPTAVEKYIADWQEQPERRIAASQLSWPMGPDDALLNIVMWGDLQESNCARADAQIRAYLKRTTGVRYEFRAYPFDQSCNNFAANTVFPYGCVAAKAALAAGLVGGADAYWAMHTWLLAHQQPLNDEALRAGAAAAGVDFNKLLAAMETDQISRAMTADQLVARNFGLRSVPFIMVNGKWVPRWSRNDEPAMLDMILDAARKAASSKSR